MIIPGIRRETAVQLVTTLCSSDNHGRAWLATAGEAVGLIAGAVAVVYTLGGLVFAARLLLDRSSVAETVGVVGQLSREFLITVGFVQVVGVAALVGVAAGMVLLVLDPPVPSPRREAAQAEDASPSRDAEAGPPRMTAARAFSTGSWLSGHLPIGRTFDGVGRLGS